MIINLTTVWRRTCVRLQNLPWYKTGLVSRQVLHLLSKLQSWICPKTGHYKTCLALNTKIEASIRATKPKPWHSHLTSEIVEIFIQNEKAGLVPMQNRFWCVWFRVGTKPVLEHAQNRFWSRHKAGFGAVGLGSVQSRFWSRHKAGLGVTGYKTGFVSRQVLHLLSKLQKWICPKTGQYKTCIVSNNYIYVYIYIGLRLVKPAASKPALRLCQTCCTTTGFVPSLNLLWLSGFGFSGLYRGFNLSIWY